MPTYSIDGPDGRTYSIDGPEGATREQVIAVIQERIAAMPDPITRQSTFGEEVERGVARSLEAKRLGIEQLLGDDPNQAILDSIQRERETAEGLGIPPSLDRITSIAKEDGPFKAVTEAVSDIPRAAGQQAGVLATMGAGARAA